jgi:hypothetical protein
MSEGTIIPSEVERRWGISQKAQMHARQNGKMCPWMTINGRVYYRTETFLRWLDEREAESASQMVAGE